ncbi:hypothetical protein ACWGJT_09695 [Streptomyces xantholiticus]
MGLLSELSDGSLAVDATPVRTFARGRKANGPELATDPDAGWYVRDGDHRDPDTLPVADTMRSRAKAGRQGAAAGRGSGKRPSLKKRAKYLFGFARPSPSPATPAATRSSSTTTLPIRTSYPPSSSASRSTSPVIAPPTTASRSSPASAKGDTSRATWLARETWIRLIAARKPYRLKPKENEDAEGHQRVMCPAEAGKAQCPVKPRSMGRGIHLPLVDPEPSPVGPLKICRQRSITLAPAEGAKHWQALDYGDDKWQKVYFRLRNSVEGYNGYAKNPLAEAIEAAGSRRIRGPPPRPSSSSSSSPTPTAGRSRTGPKRSPWAARDLADAPTTGDGPNH